MTGLPAFIILAVVMIFVAGGVFNTSPLWGFTFLGLGVLTLSVLYAMLAHRNDPEEHD